MYNNGQFFYVVIQKYRNNSSNYRDKCTMYVSLNDRNTAVRRFVQNLFCARLTKIVEINKTLRRRL